MATIKDIARQLNISTSTVSYALNGGPRNVPESVREAVLKLARELNYRPNQVAKSLVTRRSNTIGLLPTQTNPDLTNSPYFHIAFNAILNHAEAHGQDVLVFSRFAPDLPEVDQIVATLSDGRADGVIMLAPFVDSPIVGGLLERGTPFAVTNTDICGVPSYTCDNRHGVRVALEYLHSLGHRKVAHLAGPATLTDGGERCAAFVAIAGELGLETRPDWIVPSHLEANLAREGLLPILQSKDRPTAVFCFNDDVASGAYKAAESLGMRIPDDLSVIGFDNSFRCEHLTPSLTSVEQPIDLLARFAFEAVMAQVNRKPAESQRLLTRLVVRESTASPA
ncbi:MAG: LacI family DNA-binding transcriptional regulator [Fimbriimonas sp.]